MDSRPKGVGEFLDKPPEERMRHYLEAIKKSSPPGWQPIETAPRDGTWIIMVAKGVSLPTVAHVRGPVTDYSNLGAPPKEWDVEARALNCSTSTWLLSEFTHWMPLPSPPECLESGE
jgi:hypothetical protein